MGLYGHEDLVTSVKFTPNCRLVISGSDDRTVRACTPAAHLCPPPPPSIHRSNHTRTHNPYVPTIRPQVRVWNASTGSCVRVLRGHTSMVRAVAVMPEGHRIVSAGTDGTIRVWDIETGQNLAVVGGRLGHVQALVTMPDGRGIVSGDYDRVRVHVRARA
jgi:WD40 repeat protein